MSNFFKAIPLKNNTRKWESKLKVQVADVC